MSQQVSPHQAAFDKMYITSPEIVDLLQISRPTITSLRAQGILTVPITITGLHTMIWLRSEVESKLAEYKILLDQKRAKKC